MASLASLASSLQEARVAAVEAKVAMLERKLSVEMTMRDGFSRLAAQYEKTQNTAAKADVLASVRVARSAIRAGRRC